MRELEVERVLFVIVHIVLIIVSLELDCFALRDFIESELSELRIQAPVERLIVDRLNLVHSEFVLERTVLSFYYDSICFTAIQHHSGSG